MFADDVTVIGVAGRDKASTFQEWISTHEVDSFDHIADPSTSVWREFRITAQPAFTFINDDGTRQNYLGTMGLEGLTERFQELVET